MGFRWIFFLGAFLELAYSQVTITVRPSDYVDENVPVVTTCTYRSRAGEMYRLAVNNTPGPPVTGGPTTVGMSESYTIVSILESNSVFRSFSPDVVVDFSFNAKRDYDGYNLSCVLSPFNQSDLSSSVVPFRVRYGPCCNRTARDALVTCPRSDHFLLDASDIVEDAGNPQAVVIWTYSNKWSAVPVGYLNQSLKVDLPSIDMVTDMFHRRTVRASAMNDYGKTALDFHVRVTAVENVTCGSSVAAVNCTWSGVIGIGGAEVPGYRILLKNSSNGVIVNETRETSSFSISTRDTSLDINVMYTVEVRAISGGCEGPGSSDEFTAPGPPSLPQQFKCSESSPSQVLLTWSHPMYDHPDLPRLGYVVSYRNETLRRVLPRTDRSQFQLLVGGLLPSTTYFFNVTAENDFGMSIPARANCTTPAAGTPTAVSLNQPEPIPGGVRLSWTAPNPGRTGVGIELYHVAYQCESENKKYKDFGDVTMAELSDLGGSIMCTFTVTATNTIGLTSPTTEASSKNATTGAFEEESDTTNIVVIVVPIIFAVLAVILVIVFLWWYCYYRKRSKLNDSNDKHEPKETRTSSPPTQQAKNSSSQSKQTEQGIQYADLDIGTKGSSKQPAAHQGVSYAAVNHASKKTAEGGIQYADLDLVDSGKRGSRKRQQNEEGVSYAAIAQQKSK